MPEEGYDAADHEYVCDVLAVTVQGIAAGMQNTG